MTIMSDKTPVDKQEKVFDNDLRYQAIIAELKCKKNTSTQLPTKAECTEGGVRGSELEMNNLLSLLNFTNVDMGKEQVNYKRAEPAEYQRCEEKTTESAAVDIKCESSNIESESNTLLSLFVCGKRPSVSSRQTTISALDSTSPVALSRQE